MKRSGTKRSEKQFALRPVAPAPSPSGDDVYRAAKRYVAAGLSLIPIRASGDKMPAFRLLEPVWCSIRNDFVRSWGRYKSVRPDRPDLRRWFRDADEAAGMAVIGGAVSGNLSIIDCDNWVAAEAWAAAVERAAPGLLGRLVLVQTPRPGLHAYFRCKLCGGNEKLARVPDPSAGGRPKTVIEVKAEGGYCLAPPSPAGCHPTGRTYTFVGPRTLADVPTIRRSERAVLFDCARKLNLWVEPERRRPARASGPGPAGGRPGDDFNARGDWGDILERHGWRWVRTGAGGAEYWRRPGKRAGTSATTDFAGAGLLYVFSANAAPFEPDSCYSKFQAFALLNHDGDFADAARALARRGYGTGNRHARSVRDPFERYGGYATRSRSP